MKAERLKQLALSAAIATALGAATLVTVPRSYAERERCWNAYHRWWDGHEHRWHEDHDFDRR